MTLASVVNSIFSPFGNAPTPTPTPTASSGSLISASAIDLQREADISNDQTMVVCQSPGPGMAGVSLPRYLRSTPLLKGYTLLQRLPADATITTGLTLVAYVSDEGQIPADLGKAIVLGFTLKRIAANSSLNVDQGGAAERTLAVTLSATSGAVAIGTLAIAAADLPASLAGGDLLLMRIRRVATDARDTAPGRGIFYRIEVDLTP